MKHTNTLLGHYHEHPILFTFKIDATILIAHSQTKYDCKLNTDIPQVFNNLDYPLFYASLPPTHTPIFILASSFLYY